MTHGFGLQAQVITSKIVAQAAFERSKGKILPLSSREELTVLGQRSRTMPAKSTPPLRNPAPAQWRENPHPERTATPSSRPRTLFLCKGSSDEEGRPTQRGYRYARTRGEKSVLSTQSTGTDRTLPQGGGRPSDGDSRSSALPWTIKSASRTELLDIQYFLARTLESAGQIAEAVNHLPSYRRNESAFQGCCLPSAQLSSKVKYLTNGEQPARQRVVDRQCHQEFSWLAPSRHPIRSNKGHCSPFSSSSSATSLPRQGKLGHVSCGVRLSEVGSSAYWYWG